MISSRDQLLGVLETAAGRVTESRSPRPSDLRVQLSMMCGDSFTPQSLLSSLLSNAKRATQSNSGKNSHNDQIDYGVSRFRGDDKYRRRASIEQTERACGRARLGTAHLLGVVTFAVHRRTDRSLQRSSPGLFRSCPCTRTSHSTVDANAHDDRRGRRCCRLLQRTGTSVGLGIRTLYML